LADAIRIELPAASVTMRKVSFAVAIALVWLGLWWLTLPVYPRFWLFETLPVYGFVLFLVLIFVSLPFWLLGDRATRGTRLQWLYWTPIAFGIVVAAVWGLAAVP
jgi:hypothetical protein